MVKKHSVDELKLRQPDPLLSKKLQKTQRKVQDLVKQLEKSDPHHSKQSSQEQLEIVKHSMLGVFSNQFKV